MNLNEAYELLQEEFGLEVGDEVKVLRKAKDYEMGWGNTWASGEMMTEMVGNSYTIEDIDSHSGIGLSNGWYVPFFILEVTRKKR